MHLLYRPKSPLSLAISAILALIPRPNDPTHSSTLSVLQRRAYANEFAKLANAAVEVDCELLASSTNPSQALLDRPCVHREPLHPQTPVELESILALLVLSIYEYAQRGNLLKMKSRASQALGMALDRSLHSQGKEDGLIFAEARRRAWWMTYYCALQCSIVSGSSPFIVPKDPNFVTPYPNFASDPEGWSLLMNSQEILASASQFIVELKSALVTNSDGIYIHERMRQLDEWMSSVLKQTEINAPVVESADPGSQAESMTARNVRSMCQIKLNSAKIKTHRFQAFHDIPIFIRKHCDLTVADILKEGTSSVAVKTLNSENGSNCSGACGEETTATGRQYVASSSASSTSSDLHPYPAAQISVANGSPYSSEYSAEACLRAAVGTSLLFESLSNPGPHSIRVVPFSACCIMQSSYALLMLYYKARVMNQLTISETGKQGVLVPEGQFVETIHSSLGRLIDALANCSLAFEALDGMRGRLLFPLYIFLSIFRSFPI